jgi:heat shock protein HslJ
VLESIDGEPLPSVDGQGKVPTLDFGEQMTVSGNLGCNQFNGKGVLRDGKFLIEAMASTRMMCQPPWSDIELRLQTVLGSESSISLDADKKLTLTSANGTLVYALSDWVAASANPTGSSQRQARGTLVTRT